MERTKQILDVISEISRFDISKAAQENRLALTGEAWLDELEQGLNAESDGDRISAIDCRIELGTIIDSLLRISGTPQVNSVLGRALSLLMTTVHPNEECSRLMHYLLDDRIVSLARQDKKRQLVISSGSRATRVALFEGVKKLYESIVHLAPDVDDSIELRANSIKGWMDGLGIDLDMIEAIACRGGFLKPIPSGIYPFVPAMFQDMAKPGFDHPSNMAIFIGRQLARMSGRESSMLLTISDPVVCDEVDTVERLTGINKIRRDGSGAHYLSHKAMWRVLARVLGRLPRDLNMITAHIGGGISIAAHRDGLVTARVEAFGGLPSGSRSGSIDTRRLLANIRSNAISLKELEAAVSTKGGLLSLAGTNDFNALVAFMRQGATEDQVRKIKLILDFIARRIAAAILKLSADGRPVDLISITGELADRVELVDRIVADLGGKFPLVRMPGSIENHSLAAGSLSAMYAPEKLKNYEAERDALKEKRAEEDRLLDTTVFERSIYFRRKGAPLTSLDEIIDSARMAVKAHSLPTIAIVGAHTEESILAAKRANEEGRYRIAKFLLVGDFTQINQTAYDFDLVIDNDNYTIVDTDDPVAEAVSLLEEGRAQILMKGHVHTKDILSAAFKYAKAKGKIKKGAVISHVAVADLPLLNKLLAFSDGAVNTYPDETKRIAILENALKVMHNLNIRQPRTAIISAIESVNVNIDSSIEAERIAKHFTGREDCLVEGPLSFDVAMDPRVAADKHYSGEIKGNADLLILPDIDAGNVLWKTLTTVSGASLAGVILCGDLPLVLTSRGDSAKSKLASLSLAVKLFFDLKPDNHS